MIFFAPLGVGVNEENQWTDVNLFPIVLFYQQALSCQEMGLS